MSGFTFRRKAPLLTLMLWGLFSGGLLSVSAPVVQAKSVLAPTTQRLLKLEKQLSSLSEDVYERLDQLEALQAQLKALEKASEINTGYRLALQGLTLYHLANTRNEMGASAVDYWAYVIEVVEPLQHQAKQIFDQALSHADTPQTVKAWSYFYRGELQFEYAEDAARQDFAKACELGYTQACTLK